MDWQLYWTFVLQGSIAIVIILVVIVLGASVYKTIKGDKKDDN
jgi:hypothetical protein